MSPSARPDCIELNDGTLIPILFENRSVLAIDKPAGWMLVPFTWQKTNRNLHAAIVSAISSKKFWARSRNLKFLCHVHRLDTETTGILLLAKSRGALDTLGDLFEARRVKKRYLTIVHGAPSQKEWTCRLKISQDTQQIGRVQIDEASGKEAETCFSVLGSNGDFTLIDARPVTGRTHQIRVHLASAGLFVVGDPLYGREPATAKRSKRPTMALRAIDMFYRDPFTKKPVAIHAPFADFVRQHGYDPGLVPPFREH
jgi:RluA family pseudouridine synthase